MFFEPSIQAIFLFKLPLQMTLKTGDLVEIHLPKKESSTTVLDYEAVGKIGRVRPLRGNEKHLVHVDVNVDIINPMNKH